jgi:Protein of unknown function (DUF3830)
VATEIVLTFVEEDVSARATLLVAEAPRTCATILEHLPIEAAAHHAIYSGSEVAMILPTLIREEPENARSDVHQGEVGFVWMAGGSHFGVESDFAEVCWFYDVDSRPSMWEGPTPVSVFAHLGDAERFFAVCRRMRTEGAKTVRITRG